MELTHEELEKYLLLIFTKEKLEYIDDDMFIFRQPDNYIKMKADLIYSESFNAAVDEGMLPLEELEKVIRDRGMFTEHDEKNLSSLESRLSAQSVLLSKVNRVGGDPTRVMSIISNIRKEIDEIFFQFN